MSTGRMSSFITRPEIEGTFGVVASTTLDRECCCQWGYSKGGGNAFDRRCRRRLTLQVVEPHLNGPAARFRSCCGDKRR